jgi:hypothetical protein
MGGVGVMVGVRVALRKEVGLRLGVRVMLDVGLGVRLGVSASGVVLPSGFSCSLGEGVGERGGKSTGGSLVLVVESAAWLACPSVARPVGRLSVGNVEAGVPARLEHPTKNMNTKMVERTRRIVLMRRDVRVR